ncbi:Rz1-like lysis system protein LysC [Spirabiliibacterium mucosae]|uniref:Rz1-like lysis system protein LysC n=1 Tax=Spirabiliibacterium mucosae TaxID=28156 RepID=UPI003D02EE88
MRLFVNRYYRRIVLIVACLMMLLNGCAQQPIERVEYLFPPQIYLIPCTQTDFTGTTYGEAITYLRKVQYEREVCASRLSGVIDWYNEKNRESSLP